jgi:pyruvate formate lyase activating enzyme
MQLINAAYFEKCEGGTVQCTLCPHGCRIPEGKTGKCLVRKNLDGALYAEGYGRITSVALDPIEKKPLRLFCPGSHILSVGSYGCNFNCGFCQNFGISQEKSQFRYTSPEQLVALALKAKSDGNIGIAFTYNEPLTAYEFVCDCAKLAKSRGLKNVIVTNGYICKEPMVQLLPYIDAMNIDLKAFTNDYYRELCGGSLEPVKDTIRLCAKSCHVEVTTLVIPGLNDSTAEIDAAAGFLASISPEIALHLTRHHPDFHMTEPAPVSRERLFELAGIAKQHLNNVFCGNC